MRAIKRAGSPLQLSLLETAGPNLTPAETEQADKIRFNARLDYNASASFLGEDAMIQLMTEPLLYPDTETTKQATKAAVTKPATKTKTSSKTTTAKTTSGKAAPFARLPGPQVKVTGKMLKSVPKGYRMEVNTTNYWTNRAMTSTRKIYLNLTGDGQFSFGSFSIAGSLSGMPGTGGSIFTSDKKGSTGTVYGNTNPGGPGTKSVALIKRDDLDGSKYGTYYIHGDTISFAYANGKKETRSFKTDGYKTLILDDKKYFVTTPNGWERRNGDGAVLYRSLDGRYRARVTKLDYKVSDGPKWFGRYTEKLKKAGLYVSSGKIETFGSKTGNYSVAKLPYTLRNEAGEVYSRDFYLKHGRFTNRMVQIQRFSGAKGDKDVLDFISYVGN